MKFECKNTIWELTKSRSKWFAILGNEWWNAVSNNFRENCSNKLIYDIINVNIENFNYLFIIVAHSLLQIHTAKFFFGKIPLALQKWIDISIVVKKFKLSEQLM